MDGHDFVEPSGSGNTGNEHQTTLEQREPQSVGLSTQQPLTAGAAFIVTRRLLRNNGNHSTPSSSTDGPSGLQSTGQSSLPPVSDPREQHSQPPVASGPQTQQTSALRGFWITINPIRRNGKPYNVFLSQPAQAQDVNQIPKNDRVYIGQYVYSIRGKADARMRQWFKEVKEAFWRDVLARFTSETPPTMMDEVCKLLCRSHPCISDPWTSHIHYKSMLGTSSGKIHALAEWVGETNSHQTWRDTLRAKTKRKDRKDRKDPKDPKVPVVSRADVLALAIVLKEGVPTADIHDTGSSTAREKWDILERCKLTYLISREECVDPDPYWAGLEKALEGDPQQEQLYNKVTTGYPAATPAATGQDGVGQAREDFWLLMNEQYPPADDAVSQLTDAECHLTDKVCRLTAELRQANHYTTVLEDKLRAHGLSLPPPDATTSQPEDFQES